MRTTTAPGVAIRRLERLGHHRADDATAVLEPVEPGEAVGAVDHVQEAEHGGGDEPPPDGQAPRARRPAGADEGDADHDQPDRDGEAGHPGEPAEQLLDAAPEGTGHAEVDRQGEEGADDDEADAEELVLAAGDGAAQFLGRLGPAPGARRGRGGATVGRSAGLARGRAARGLSPRLALRRAPRGHPFTVPTGCRRPAASLLGCVRPP